MKQIQIPISYHELIPLIQKKHSFIDLVKLVVKALNAETLSSHSAARMGELWKLKHSGKFVYE
jgi:hypothetical protein